MATLVARTEVNGRTRKLYDRPSTPLQRLLASGASGSHHLALAIQQHAGLSPLTIKRRIDRHISAEQRTPDLGRWTFWSFNPSDIGLSMCSS